VRGEQHNWASRRFEAQLCHGVGRNFVESRRYIGGLKAPCKTNGQRLRIELRRYEMKNRMAKERRLKIAIAAIALTVLLLLTACASQRKLDGYILLLAPALRRCK
jgi:hypothetical protein